LRRGILSLLRKVNETMDSAVSTHESIAAVVVTYNRSRLLLECLDALLRQTRPVDKIVLIDNASSDGTTEVLASAGYLANPKIDYIRLESNSGGAGGFHEGMKRAYDSGFDWIWIMDDDAEPYDDALEKMQPGFERPNIGGIANLTIGLDGLPQLEHRGWLALHGTTSRAHRAIDAGNLTRIMEISFASFVGLAVHRSAIRRIGLPKREMFIKADDLEYCVRLATLGPLILVPESRIRHKDAVATGYERRRRFGLESNRVPLDKLWLSYFSLRNLLWIRRAECGNLLAATFAARQYLRCLLGILMFDSNRLVRLRFYWNAISDAWRGVFDNEKPRRLTAVR
jgi:rhamnopyranosyl-N-acetylglucosaminyl-diphospho-decaprenol beta-1,3/1,4-galactofuranosyltransferase